MQAFVAALGWTLLHFLWQGLLVGVLFALLMRVLVRGTATTRYRTGLFCLAILAVTPAATFAMLYPAVAGPPLEGAHFDLSATVTATALAGETGAWLSWLRSLIAGINVLLPWAVAAWLAGIGFHSLRLIRDWREVRKLRSQGTRPLPIEWQHRVAGLMRGLGVTATVRILESTAVRVPMLIGWAKPVVLIPSSAFLGLTPRQLELLIAHELAHVLRHDYLINLIQILLETVFFFHPVVRWMSNRIRAERENCCDDQVVARCGDTLTYARALAQMESLRSPRVSIAASGGQLFGRINRLVNVPARQRGGVHWLIGLLLGSGALAMLGGTRLVLDSQDEPELDLEPVERVVAIETIELAGPQIDATVPTQGDLPESIEQESREAQKQNDSEKQAENEREIVVPEVTTGGVGADTVALEDEQILETEDGPAQVPTMLAVSETLPVPEVALIERPEPVITGGHLISGEQPEYPVRARYRAVEGEVTVRFIVTEQGEVRDLKVIDATRGTTFIKPVARAISGWRFEPFRVDDVAVARTVEHTIEFKLDEQAQADAACGTRTGSRICKTPRAGDRILPVRLVSD